MEIELISLNQYPFKFREVVFKSIFLISIFFPSFVHSAELSTNKYESFQAKSMGTLFRLELGVASRADGERIFQRCLALLNNLESKWSPWIEDSLIWKINHSGFSGAIPVDRNTFALLHRAHSISVLTKGAFDITFASVGHLYDYRKNVKPSAHVLPSKLNAIDYRKVQLHKKDMSVSLSDAQVKVDLGGIAKGEAIDQLLGVLKQAGVTSAYFSLGGDSYVLGKKKSYPWMLGIKHPRDRTRVVARIPLEDVAVSTSGDYERFFIEEGERYHHILSPLTGASAKGLMSATVIGPEGWRTDALSTSLFVLGLEEGIALIEALPNYDAIAIDSLGEIHATSGLISSGN